MAVLVVALVAGCATPQQQADDVCGGIADEVAGLATIAPRDTKVQIVPLLDAQLAIAGSGRAELADLAPAEAERARDDDLLARWDGLVDALTALRDVWVDPAEGRKRYLGDDLVIALTISATKAGVDGAEGHLRDAANAYAAPRCGSIPWRSSNA